MATQAKSPQKIVRTEAEKNAKVTEFKLNKADYKLLKSMHFFFGFFAVLCLLYAGYIAFEFARTDTNPKEAEQIVKALITTLYYPVFYLLGYIFSRRAMQMEKFQLALLLSVFLPLTPLGIALVMWGVI